MVFTLGASRLSYGFFGEWNHDIRGEISIIEDGVLGQLAIPGVTQPGGGPTSGLLTPFQADLEVG